MSEEQARLEALRLAAKIGFDQIEQGQGIVLKNQTDLNQFMRKIDAEVLAKNSSLPADES